MLAALRSQLQHARTSLDLSPPALARSGVRLLALLVGFVLLTPVTVIAPPAIGLDPSWAIGIHLALQEKLTFGRDIVFTYGPLGFLFTRLPIAASHWQYLLRDALLMALVAFVLVVTLRQVTSLWALLLTLLAILVSSATVVHHPVVYLPTFIFLAFLVALLAYLHSQHLAALLLAAVLTLVLFFAKANVGLPALALMLALFVYLLLFPGRLRRRSIGALAGLFLVALAGLSLLLRTDLPGYLAGAWHLSSAYNDAMFLPLESTGLDPELLTMAVTLFVALAAAGLIHRRQLLARREALLGFLLMGLALFLVFKHGFVRADLNHVRSFFPLAALAIALLAPFQRGRLQRDLYAALLLALLFSTVLSADLYQPRYVLRRFREFYRYLTVKIAELPQDVALSALQPHLLPDSVRAAIGDATVDVVPWDISYVLANGLAYNPRPVIQSYTAYDDYLDSLNQAKYLSSSGPDYILFTPGDIDGRHPFFTESRTRLAMLRNYQVSQRLGDMLLLQRRADPLPFSESVSPPQEARLGETIEFAGTGGLKVMTANIRYNALGHLLRLLFQPPLLQVTVHFADGEERTYRAIQSIVNGQVLVNPLVDSPDTAEQFFATGGQGGRTVTSIRFDAPPGAGFQPDFTYFLKEIDIVP